MRLVLWREIVENEQEAAILVVEFLRKLSQRTAICSAEGAFALPLRQGRVRAVPACRSTTDGHN